MEEYNIKVYDNGSIEFDDGEEICPTIIACDNLKDTLEVLKKLIISNHNEGEK